MTRRRGIRAHGRGVEAFVRVNGRLYTKSFPNGTPLKTLDEWRRAKQLEAGRAARLGGLLADDAARYLRAVAAMPTIANRRFEIGCWVAALGPRRRRDSIRPDEIAAVLARWEQEEQLAPQTLRLRLNALAHLFRVLDGPTAPNPARLVPRPKPTPAALAVVPMTTVAAILATMRPSPTRSRLRVLATTGLPQKQIAQLVPGDLDLVGRTVRTTPRRKGRGAEGRILPLADAAVAAFEEFIAQDAFGPFSTSSMRTAFRRACARARRAGVVVPETLRPYDLRHAFAATVYRRTRDLAAVARLLGHASTAITSRYATAAFEDVDRAALDAAADELGIVGWGVGRPMERVPRRGRNWQSA